MLGMFALHLYIILSHECFGCCCGTTFSIPIFFSCYLENHLQMFLWG